VSGSVDASLHRPAAHPAVGDRRDSDLAAADPVPHGPREPPQEHVAGIECLLPLRSELSLRRLRAPRTPIRGNNPTPNGRPVT